MAKDKADEKRRAAITHCAEFMEEVEEKVVNHMATFSLGQHKNIVTYHFGSYAYRENKKDKKGSVVS